MAILHPAMTGTKATFPAQQAFMLYKTSAIIFNPWEEMEMRPK